MDQKQVRAAAAILALAAIAVGFVGLLTGTSTLAFIGYGTAVVLWAVLKFTAKKTQSDER
jgi:flagellar biosynthesis component FlhA